MRIAVYGGSFNPPHVGHGMVAAWLGWTDTVDEVWLVPTYAHPFGKQLAPFEARIRMCEGLASGIGSWVKVSGIESALEQPSYTIHTLDTLSERFPENSFRPVMGADLLPELSRWKEASRLKAQYPPIIVGRAGYDSPANTVTFPRVSSTEIRRLLSSGQSADRYLPVGVRGHLGGHYASRGSMT